ncbi:MAG TPA: hypothetical protein VFU15_16375 [Bacteroidia bacterium]|nr:hypothetical protein [Bacteroidia bacterium]
MEKPRMNNPCPQDWNKMSPSATGRFCAKCCKVVVDFTQKTAEEIRDYLAANAGTCGRFSLSQLQPLRQRVMQKVSWRMRRFSLALYLIFGSLLFTGTACGGEVDYYGKQDSAYSAQQSAHRNDSLKKDSVLRMDSHKKDSAQETKKHH